MLIAGLRYQDIAYQNGSRDSHFDTKFIQLSNLHFRKGGGRVWESGDRVIGIEDRIETIREVGAARESSSWHILSLQRLLEKVWESLRTRQPLRLSKKNGSSGRTRTYNPPVNSRMLCH